MQHDHCAGCQALWDEVVKGTKPELMDRAEGTYEHYRIRLLKKGWGGLYSPAERTYIRAHRPVTEKQKAAFALSGERLAAAGFTKGGEAEGLKGEE